MVSLGSRLSLQSSSGLRCYYGWSLNSDRKHFLPISSTFPSTTIVRQNSSKISTVLSSFLPGKKRKEEEERKTREEEEAHLKIEQSFELEAKQEQREEFVRRQMNRSRLNASDRRVLKGQFPYVGVIMEESDKHREPKFKAEMLAKYGRETGINPSVAWPTKEQIEEDREYERVLYDGLSIRQMMDNTKENRKKEAEEIEKREKEFVTKLASMKKDLKAWRVRVEAKNKLAEKERQKKEKILAELKQEYGYAINPSDPQFAEKIAAKEKEWSKQAKEEKKKMRQDRKTDFKKAEETETTEEKHPEDQQSS